MNYPINLSYKSNQWKARQIKKAVLSTGYVVYLFELEPDPCVIGFFPYVVAVKSPIDHTCEWHRYNKCSFACQDYLNYLCIYA